jgi:CheY-like chemotaxis protein
MTQAKQILLVDDQADAIDALAMLLELDGYTVRTAYSGADALAAIETFIPDLALIDVSMPNMNGMQLARLLRHNAALANTRLIALTKPVSADQLTQLIEGTGD